MDQRKREDTIRFLRQMTRVTLTLKGFMRQRFREHGIDITFEMLQVLRFLWENRSANQQEIAYAIIKDKASLTYLIDNLVRRNLVQRTEASKDRRHKIITLTPDGKELEGLIMPWLEEMYELVAQGIPAEEFVNGLHLFETIGQNFRPKAPQEECPGPAEH